MISFLPLPLPPIPLQLFHAFDRLLTPFLAVLVAAIEHMLSCAEAVGYPDGPAALCKEFTTHIVEFGH